MLHGDALRRLLAGAKPQRFYVPVRAADYAGLTRLGRADGSARAAGTSRVPSPTLVSRPRTSAIAARRNAKPIRDMATGAEYSSEYQAGKALCGLVGGVVTDRFVWFKIRRAFPTRFQTKNSDGAWVSKKKTDD